MCCSEPGDQGLHKLHKKLALSGQGSCKRKTEAWKHGFMIERQVEGARSLPNTHPSTLKIKRKENTERVWLEARGSWHIGRLRAINPCRMGLAHGQGGKKFLLS